MRTIRLGFSLIEMAIVIVILSVLIGSVYALIPVQTDQQNIDITKTKMDRIQAAIDTYVNLNGHLPCPAAADSTLSSATFGVATDCTASAPTGTTEVGAGDDTIRRGVLPTRTLNIPDSFMFDAWSNRFGYTVIKKLATTSSNFSSAAPTLSAIIIQDASGNQINSIPVAYTLISYGKDGDGATHTSGTTVASCTAGLTESSNCTSTSNIFIDAFHNDNSTNYYDDYIRWKTKSLQVRDSSYPGSSTFGGTSFSKFALVADEKASGSAPQAILPGSNNWNSRNLNTIVVQSTPSPISSISAAAGTITLDAGNYYIRATAPSQGVAGNRLRIVDTATNLTLAIGMSGSGDTVGSPASQTTTSVASVVGYFNFTSATTIRIDHFIASYTASGQELGAPVSNGNNEVYTMVEIFGQ